MAGRNIHKSRKHADGGRRGHEAEGRMACARGGLPTPSRCRRNFRYVRVTKTWKHKAYVVGKLGSRSAEVCVDP